MEWSVWFTRLLSWILHDTQEVWNICWTAGYVRPRFRSDFDCARRGEHSGVLTPSIAHTSVQLLPTMASVSMARHADSPAVNFQGARAFVKDASTALAPLSVSSSVAEKEANLNMARSHLSTRRLSLVFGWIPGVPFQASRLRSPCCFGPARTSQRKRYHALCTLHSVHRHRNREAS
jgi:hypothetical protein